MPQDPVTTVLLELALSRQTTMAHFSCLHETASTHLAESESGT
jgi:hypothetical protein